ncbi:hypothetical protein C7H19_17195 [Aphanothece hegewaldii CCALA 016]|uniref:Uncharacterized protein n=1 Tax=Aphanothece hegewaldii CCALA 016 TaxID=2107694 RepID=A0A2T1LUQ8_9CHRO|nr:hypothetical protein [Aphanothece hegewaldii]PSF35294.1 hypothetical protein C7H19_17195 [Aphanothece hegewaldii CCALA 016]
MKYFFLSEGWIVGRVWEFGGLWDTNAWRRQPKIQRLNIGIVEREEILWLYEVEEAVLMLEVAPGNTVADTVPTIGQVVLRRLMSAEQVIERLRDADEMMHRDRSNLKSNP